MLETAVRKFIHLKYFYSACIPSKIFRGVMKSDFFFRGVEAEMVISLKAQKNKIVQNVVINLE